MLLNYGVGEGFWESLGLQGNHISQCERQLTPDCCWSWSSNTLATWCEELTHWKKTLMLAKIESTRSRWQRMRCLDCIRFIIDSLRFIDSMDLNLSKLRKIVEDSGAWHAVHGLAKNWIRLSNWTTTGRESDGLWARDDPLPGSIF